MRLSDRVIFQASSAAAVSRRASESLYRRLTLRASAKGGGNAEAPAGGTLTEPLPSRIFRCAPGIWWGLNRRPRSEEHTSELQSLMRISYAVFCLKKKKK